MRSFVKRTGKVHKEKGISGSERKKFAEAFKNFAKRRGLLVYSMHGKSI